MQNSTGRTFAKCTHSGTFSARQLGSLARDAAPEAPDWQFRKGLSPVRLLATLSTLNLFEVVFAEAQLDRFHTRERAESPSAAAPSACCALHKYVTTNPTSPSEPAEALKAAALRAQSWYGEPFLHAEEDPAVALAPGTARRTALDDALAEINAGRRVPSNRWRVRYGLMLGLERVLASPTPETASGTDLRRHQVDALAGMLTELIASNQRAAEENANGNGHAVEADAAELDEEDDDFDAGVVDDELDDETPAFRGEDPGASRRYRFRHPTASGKTIAAAGFVESARHLG